MRTLPQTLKNGFTLTEILVAMFILATVTAVAVPLYTGYLASTRTVDVLNALKALELEVRAPAVARSGLVVCDNSLVLQNNLQSNFVRLDIASTPNAVGNPQAGSAAVLVVSARLDVHGAAGIQVAKNLIEEIENTRPKELLAGYVETDSVVTFNLILSEPGRPFCSGSPAAVVATSTPVSNNATSTTTTAANITLPPIKTNAPPIAGQKIYIGSSPEGIALPIPTAVLLKASSDPDGDTLVVTSIKGSPGQVKKEANGKYIYQPPTGFSGEVNVSFVISDGVDSASGSGSITILPAPDAPIVNLTFSAEQQVMTFDSSGKGAVITNGKLKTGDMKHLAMEFNVIGGQQVKVAGIHGATFVSYGTTRTTNEFFVWRPSNVTVYLFDTGYATGFNASDGKTHRYSVLWSSDTGVLTVIEDGTKVKVFQGVGKGASIPGEGVLVLAQDQDGYIQIEDGSHGGNHGFAPDDAFHGQIFSTTMAHVAVDPDRLRKSTLSEVVGRNKGLIADIQMSASGQATDVTGNHQLTQTTGSSVTTVQVDTSVAVPNPGALLHLSTSATAAKGDIITKLELSGLLAGTKINDGAGIITVSSPAQKIDLLSLNTNSLTAQLPANVVQNMTIKLTATAVGADGSTRTATDSKPLVMDRTQAVP